MSSSEGQRLSLGGILKYVQGNVFGAASLVGGYSWADGSRLITMPGLETVATTERENWLLSARVRGGYSFQMTESLSIVPSLDLNLPVIYDKGYRESGAGEFDMEVLSSTNVVPDMYPAVQISKYVSLGEVSVRGWVEVGKRIRLDDLETDVRMPDGFAPDAVTSIAFSPDKTSTVWSVGLLLEQSDKLEARLVYQDERGSSSHNRSGSVKLIWKF